MRRTVSFLIACALSAGAAIAGAANANAVGTSVPSTPRYVYAYPGVDGVQVTWSAPYDTGGGINGYEVYRAAAGQDAIDIGTTDQTSLFDAVPVGDWTYTVTADNDAGESVASAPVTTTVPAPADAGAVNGLTVNGGEYGSLAFEDGSDTVSMSSTTANVQVRGVSSESSVQGAHDVTFSIRTMAGNNRIVPGTTATTGILPGQISASVTGCSVYRGSVTVDEASFLADGTPLALALHYSFRCDPNSTLKTASGVVSWHGHTPVEAITTDVGSHAFGIINTGTTSSPYPVTLANRTSATQTLGTAALSGTNADWYAIASDTCSGATLAPGESCSVAVTAEPKSGSGPAIVAQLLVPTTAQPATVTINLTYFAQGPPQQPTLTVRSGFHVVELDWQALGALPRTHTVYRGKTPQSLSPLATVANTYNQVYTYLDTTGVPGTTYYYAVSDTNDAGESPLSAPATATSLAQGILISTWRAGYAQIYARTDDGSQWPLTSGNAYSDTPAVSPDGTRFAYTRRDSSGDFNLFLSNVVGGTPRQLTSGTTTDDVTPTWSPDGTRIAFARWPHDIAVQPSLFIYSLVTGSITAVPNSTGLSEPAWSPNGQLIAATDHRTSPPSIVVSNVGGTYQRTIAGSSDVGVAAADPSWSPDGTHIAFIRQVLSTDSVAVLPAAGGTPLIVTDPSVQAAAIDWDPDGSRIVFEGYSQSDPNTLWSVDPAGAAAAHSLSNCGNGYEPCWSPSIASSQAPFVASTRPTTPSNVHAALHATSAELSWTASAGAAYYLVRRFSASAAAPTTPDGGVAVCSCSGTKVTVNGLGAGSRYGIAVFAIDALGNASSPAVRIVQPAAVPTVSPNGSMLAALVSGGPKFTARWGSTLPAGQRYDVQYGVRVIKDGVWTIAPVWRDLVVGTTSTSRTVNATAGATYYLRARIRDAAGDVTDWSATATAPVPYDDRAFSATGKWTRLTRQGNRYESTIETAKTAGARLTITASGSSYTLLADRCRTCGKLRLYVDGHLKATVDTYRASTATRQAVWTSSAGRIAKHTLTVVVVGTARRPTVRIDGLIARR